MTDKQTNKFLYEVQSSDFATTEDFNDFKEEVHELIQDGWERFFSNTGYLADCVLKGKKFFDVKVEVNSFTSTEGGESVTYKVNSLTVGEDGEESKFFIPNGVNNFLAKTINTKLVYSSLAQDISDGKVTSGAHAIIIDFTDANDPKIILAPYRKTNGTDYWQYFFARATEPELVESEPIWWDTTNNVVKQYNEAGGWVIKNYSIPVGIVILENHAISSVSQDFNITGFADQTIWVNPGIEYALPNGRDSELMINVVSKITGVNGNPEVISIAAPDAPVKDEFAVAATDTISYIKLTKPCRDKRVLSITTEGTSATSEEEVITEIEPENFTLSADQVTVVFDPAISNVNKIIADYYEEPDNMRIYMDASGELLNPLNTTGYRFNNSLGCYVNADEEPQTCIRVGAFALGYVASKNKFTNEKLSILEYESKDCSPLVNATEVEYMIKHFNNSLYESIELAIRSAAAAETDIDTLRTDVEKGIDKCKKVVDDSADGYEPYIPGGGGSGGGGGSATLEKQYDEIEVIPVGVKVSGDTGVISDNNVMGPSVTTYSSDDGSSPVYDNTKGLYNATTVRIGKDYIKASTFGTSASVYNGTTFGSANSVYNGKTFGDNSSTFRGTAAKVTVNNSATTGKIYPVRVVDGTLAQDTSNKCYFENGVAYSNAVKTTDVDATTVKATNVNAKNGTFNTLKVGAYTVQPSSTATYLITGNVDFFTSSAGEIGRLVDISSTGSTEFEIATEQAHGIVGNPADYSVVPSGKTPILFSGRQKVLVVGPAAFGDKLYLLSYTLRDGIRGDVLMIFNSFANRDDVEPLWNEANERYNNFTGVAISESLYNELMVYAQAASQDHVDAINDWFATKGSCIGRAFDSAPASIALTLVNSAVNISFND